MTDTKPAFSPATTYALRSIRDTNVIFRVGLTDLSIGFYEKVGEAAVAVPRPRAAELSRIVFGDENLVRIADPEHTAATIPFRYRNVLLTSAGHDVLRAAGA